jgi:23S rRNA (uracil1939-C5)-methyltransferase
MEVKIEKLDNFGRGITYFNNKICFVDGALEDEVVDIDIVVDKKKYQEAKVVEFLKVSDRRVKEDCPFSKVCGGCNLNHMSYSDENDFKKNKIKQLVERYTSVDYNLVSDITYDLRSNYRNKIVLHGNKCIGLYKKSSNDIVSIDNCILVDDRINSIISILNRINKSIKEATIKVSNDSKEIMVDIKGEVKDTYELINCVDVLIINGEFLTSKKQIINPIGNKKYYESNESFFQINKTLTEKLYDEALNVVKVDKPDNVLDLYCGTGTIGIYVSDYCKRIIGVDYNKSNIDDANKNKKLNNCSNIEFICDKVENQIDKFNNIDIVIVDPPRAGLDSKTKDYLKKINSKKIIYISCDPVTLMRDINDLSDCYGVKYIKPFNMFPRTYHVECVCLLERK